MVTVWGVSSLERQRAESLQINATILSGTVIIHSMQPQFPQSRERWSQCGFPHYRAEGSIGICCDGPGCGIAVFIWERSHYC